MQSYSVFIALVENTHNEIIVIYTSYSALFAQVEYAQ